MIPLLAPFESDLWAALEISDLPTRASVIDELVKAQARDRRGRWTSGGGGGGSSAAGVSAEQARACLLTSLDATVAPDQVDGLMHAMAGGTSVNLEHLQVTGAGNENMFARHATETPRSKMPQLPETAEGMRGFTDDLTARGVEHHIVHGVDPRTLHATQNELDGAKVGSIYGYIRGGGWQADSVIIASRDGAVVDGHHRWAAGSAARVAGMDFGINVLQVDMPIEDLLQVAEAHSGAHREMGAPLVVPKNLSSWERDMWAALELHDAFTRASAVELLAKAQARDRRGRFASGGGAGGGALEGQAALDATPATFTPGPEGHSGNYAGAQLAGPSGMGSMQALSEYEHTDLGWATNSGLRGFRPLSAADHARVGEIDKTMAVSKLTHDVKVHRVISSGKAVFGEAAAQPDLTGATFREHGYLSATARPAFAKEFSKELAAGGGGLVGAPVIMDMKVRKGTGGIQLDQFEGSAEIMLQRGLTVQVTADHGIGPDGFRQLDVEVTA